MEIKHNLYFDGMVQSLAFIEDNKTVKSVGIVLPGQYSFGVAKIRERITVVSGTLYINGRWFKEGETEVVDANKSIQILADAPAVYLCLYG